MGGGGDCALACHLIWLGAHVLGGAGYASEIGFYAGVACVTSRLGTSIVSLASPGPLARTACAINWRNSVDRVVCCFRAKPWAALANERGNLSPITVESSVSMCIIAPS